MAQAGHKSTTNPEALPNPTRRSVIGTLAAGAMLGAQPALAAREDDPAATLIPALQQMIAEAEGPGMKQDEKSEAYKIADAAYFAALDTILKREIESPLGALVIYHCGHGSPHPDDETQETDPDFASDDKFTRDIWRFASKQNPPLSFELRALLNQLYGKGAVS